MIKVKFENVNHINISTSVVDKNEYTENVQKAMTDIETFLYKELKEYNGEVIFDLAIPNNFFTIRPNYAIEKELLRVSPKTPQNIKNWIIYSSAYIAPS